MHDPAWKRRYRVRAGIEGTLPQGVRAFGMRRSRCIGLAKTSLQQACTGAAINVLRAVRRVEGRPRAKTRVTRFAALAPLAARLRRQYLTYVRTGEGRLFLAAVLDLHTRKIVGPAMRDTPHAEIAVEALEMAVRRQRPAPGLICHADRGVQHACEPCREALGAAGTTPSMSRKGSCLDSAPMESFSHSLKVERVHHRVHATRAEARRDLFAWIEGFHNTHRLHSALGYRSPFTGRRRARGGTTASEEQG